MGFYADTMHMARLWDTARDKMSGESKIERESVSVCGVCVR